MCAWGGGGDEDGAVGGAGGWGLIEKEKEKGPDGPVCTAFQGNAEPHGGATA